MTGVLKIQVATRSAAGEVAPVTDARVVLGRRDLVGESRWPYDDLLPTYAHTGGGYYGVWTGEASGPGEGEWLLVVSKAGFSPVVQELTLVQAGSALKALPGWGAVTPSLDSLAATVSIANVGEQDTEDALQQTTINVRLQERSELVALTGLDHTGFDCSKFPRGRRNLLWKRGRVNDGVISTLIDAKRGRVIVSVKSASRAAASWIDVDERELAPPGRSASILDFYEHLHHVGQAHPGTVLEAGVFSHAWLMGPIIVNTFDHVASVTERDPNDTDGRQKDWLPAGRESVTPTGTVTDGPTMLRFPKLKEAFHAAQGALRIWGCNHMQNVVAECQAANAQRRAGVPRDRFFRVGLVVTSSGRFVRNGEEQTTLDHVKRTIGMLAQSRYFARSPEPYDLRGAVTYAGAAAQFLGLPVFAGPPGLGSLWGRLEGEDSFFVHSGKPEQAGASPSTVADPPVHYRRQHAHPGGESRPVLEWLREEFPAVELDELRYVDYAQLLKEPLPDPGYRTERYAMFCDGEQLMSIVTENGLEENRAVVLRLASGLEVHAPERNTVRPEAVFSRPYPVELAGVGGHCYVIRRRPLTRVERRGPATVAILGKRDELLEDSSSIDSAVFVGRDGKSTWLESPAGRDDFGPLKRVVRTGEAQFQYGLTWEPPVKLEKQLFAGGVIEAVEPRWYW